MNPVDLVASPWLDDVGVIVDPEFALGEKREWFRAAQKIGTIFREKDVAAFKDEVFDLINGSGRAVVVVNPVSHHTAFGATDRNASVVVKLEYVLKNMSPACLELLTLHSTT